MKINFDRQALLALRTGTDPWQAANEVPVRLNIAGVELLGWKGWEGEGRAEAKGRDGIITPVIDMARWGLYALRQAKLSGRSFFWLGQYGEYDDLAFKMAGEEILVHSRPYNKTVRMCYKDLLTTWQEFNDGVREFVLQEFPGIKEVPYPSPYPRDEETQGWRDWLEGKEETIEPFAGVWDPSYLPGSNFEAAFQHVDLDGVEPCE